VGGGVLFQRFEKQKYFSSVMARSKVPTVWRLLGGNIARFSSGKRYLGSEKRGPKGGSAPPL